jgi:hypothetical protein
MQSLVPWLCALVGRVRGRRKFARRPAPQAKPQVETLEDRLVPAYLFGSDHYSLANGHGPVINNAHVQLIFWDPSWVNATNPSEADVRATFNSVLKGPYLSGLAQYSPNPAQPIGPGSVVGGNLTITAVAPANGSFSITTVGNRVALEITNGFVPAPESDPNLLYVVVMPKGVTVDSTSNAVDHGFGTDAKGTHFHFLWVADDGTLGGLTSSFSGRLADAVTSPEYNGVYFNTSPKPQWGGIAQGEGQQYAAYVNGELVQSYWSARDNHFLIPNGQTQNFLLGNNVLYVNGDQLANKNDVVTIDQVLTNGVYSGLQVTLNGESVFFGGLAQVVVDTGTGNDTININRLSASTTVTVVNEGTAAVHLGVNGSVQGIAGQVTLGQSGAGLAGRMTVTVDDSQDTQVRNAIIGSVFRYPTTWGTITGLLPGSVSYSPRYVTSVTVEGSLPGDTSNVQATVVPLTLINQGYSPVLVGLNGNAQSVAAALTVEHPGGANGSPGYLFVGDYADGTARNVTHDTFSPDGAIVFGRITGLTPGTIGYQTNLSDATIDLGSGGGAVNVLATAGSTLVVETNGVGAVNVGNAGSVDGIQSDLRVVVNAGFANVTLDDSANPNAKDVDLSSDGIAETVTGLAPSAVAVYGGPSSSLDVLAGTAGNIFTVEGTSPLTTYLVGGAGDDSFNVLATTGRLSVAGGGGIDTVNIGNAGSVQGITGDLSITNFNGGQTFVTVDDSADPNAQNASMDADAIYGLAPAVIHYGGFTGTASLTVIGNDTTTFTVLDTADPTQVTINAGADATVYVQNTSGPLDVEDAAQVVLGNGGTLYGVTGEVTIGASSLVGNVVVDDSADTADLAISLTAVEIDGIAPAPIIYDAVANLTLLTGPGNDTFTMTQAPQFTVLTLDAGGGINTLDYSAFNDNVLVNLQTGTATGYAGGVAHIQNVVGASGGPAGSFNVLVGNGGNVLTGGNGRRNLLIAGPSASTLIGGDDQDILIAGTTSYDLDNDALLAVMTEWGRTDEEFDTQTANLLNGNGVPALNAATAFSNGGGNELVGAGGRNLLFTALGFDALPDQGGADTVIGL